MSQELPEAAHLVLDPAGRMWLLDGEHTKIVRGVTREEAVSWGRYEDQPPVDILDGDGSVIGGVYVAARYVGVPYTIRRVDWARLAELWVGY